MMRLLIALTVALALAACGGAAPVAQAPVATTAAATTVARSTQSASTAAPAGTSSTGPNIGDLVKAGKQTNYKVTYQWTIGSGAQAVTSEQTWFSKGTNTRFDFGLGAGLGSISVYSIADGTFLCTAVGGVATCQKTSAEAALQSNPAAEFGLQLATNPGQFNSSYQGTRSIAGQQAQCYAVTGTGGFSDVTSCYSSTGVPLLTQMSAQGAAFAMEATNFSTTVSDADFVLPATVR
jgi:hypothetical protein